MPVHPRDHEPVEVLVEGTWVPGTLHQWRQDDRGAWWGLVRYRTEPGLTYYQERPASELRAATDGPANSRS
ncbi:MAG: hypothetical protein ACRDYU_13785 [Actinomycetes bacterium]